MDQYLLIALLLAGFGVVVLGAEFVVPTGGIFVVLGVLALVAAVGVVWSYGSTTEAAAATLALCIAIPVAGSALFALWQRMTIIPGADAPSATAEASGLDHLRGRYGKTVTPMRPSGAVEIEGRRVDALSEGPMIDAGVWVKCVSSRAGRVVVRAVDPPADLAGISLDDPPEL